LQKKVAIFSHDAGGGEVISSWVKENFKKYKFFFFIKGPALAIFKKKIKTIKVCQAIEMSKKADFFLCGSGWQTNFELKGLIYGRKNNKRVVVFLDHWANYKKRFIINHNLFLPTEFWVQDIFAKMNAKKTFKHIKIVKKKNYFIKNFLENYLKIKKNILKNSIKKNILYLSEPILEHTKKWEKKKFKFNYSEFDALEFLLNNIHKIDPNIIKVIIRLHPAEKKNKYNRIIDKFSQKKLKFKIKISINKSIEKDIFDSDFVAGCHTSAMVLALTVKKKVISTVPTKNKRNDLPHKKIIYLRDLK